MCQHVLAATLGAVTFHAGIKGHQFSCSGEPGLGLRRCTGASSVNSWCIVVCARPAAVSTQVLALLLQQLCIRPVLRRHFTTASSRITSITNS